MMNKVLYGLASPFHLVAFVLTIQSCWAIAYQNDECETAQLLKPRKCTCREPFTRKWHKIKCIPFVFGARNGSCSERCNKLQSCFDGEGPSHRRCLAVFRNLSSNQFNGTGNITFCVEPCRAFVFRISVISNQETLNCSRTIPTSKVFKLIKDFINFHQNISVNNENALQAGRKKRTCVVWKFSEDNFGSWSSEGCQTRATSHSLTECACNHFTHSAVLMDFTDKDGDENDLHDKALTLLTRVGMALSLTGIFLTIISYLLLTDRASPLCHIRVSLTSCIGAGHIIFFAGIDATGNKGACVSVAALEQYFVMVAFCWMLVEGIYFYLFVVKLYNITDDIRRYHGCCWGVPAIIVAVSLGIAAGKDGLETFVRDKNCWMSAPNNIIWICISFVGLTVIINIAILVRVIKGMTTIQQVKDNQAEQIRLGVHASVVLAPLLGFTWLIGFLLPLHVAFSYIFVILNSAQGFSIFFFHCLRNSEIKERFKRRCWFIKADNKITPQVNQSQDNAEIPEASSEQRV